MKFKILILLFACLSLEGVYAQEPDVDIPNVFTPNNDGVNDWFQIKAGDAYVGLTCSIYNRYGGLVYRFYGLNGSWDGYSHAGEPCVEGIYFAIIELEKADETKEVFQGNIQIIRNK